MASEALALSASIFNASIDSWLPPSFGLPSASTSIPSSSNFDIPLPSNDRLGLGHPDLDRPASMRLQAQMNRAGLERLEKTVKKDRLQVGQSDRIGKETMVGNGRASRSVGDNDGDEDEDEVESRTKAAKKSKKVKTKDVFGRRQSSGPSSTFVGVPGSVGTSKSKQGANDGLDKASQEPISTTPSSLSLEPSKQLPNTNSEINQNDCAPNKSKVSTADFALSTTSAKSKTQARREKRKRAKLAKQ